MSRDKVARGSCDTASDALPGTNSGKSLAPTDEQNPEMEA